MAEAHICAECCKGFHGEEPPANLEIELAGTPRKTTLLYSLKSISYTIDSPLKSASELQQVV